MASRGKDETVAATAARRAGLVPITPCRPMASTRRRHPTAELSDYGLPTLDAMASNPLATAFRRAFLQPPRGWSIPCVIMAAPLQGLPAFRRSPAIIPLPRSVAARPEKRELVGRLCRARATAAASSRSWRSGPSPSSPFRPAEPSRNYRSSTWIGLDGQRFYLDSSLPQIGTKQNARRGPQCTAVYGAWFQWWARGQDTAEIDLLLPVEPGDEISAIITVLDDTTVRCNLKNETQGIILQAFNASAPGPCRISGATAEWIMERPSPMGSDGWDAYDLPAYTPFAFTGCVAEIHRPRQRCPRRTMTSREPV